MIHFDRKEYLQVESSSNCAPLFSFWDWGQLRHFVLKCAKYAKTLVTKVNNAEKLAHLKTGQVLEIAARTPLLYSFPEFLIAAIANCPTWRLQVCTKTTKSDVSLAWKILLARITLRVISMRTRTIELHLLIPFCEFYI